MAVSIALGVLAGLATAQIVRLTPEFWGNVSLWILIGGAVGFFVNLLFISPIRLWREADHQLTELRNQPPAGMQVGHADQVIVIQGSIGAVTFAASSNSVIIGPDREGLLFPRGTFIQRGWFEHVEHADRWGASVIQSQDSGTAFVLPELTDKPPEPPGS